MKYETKRNILFILTMVFSSIYLLWRLFCTLPFSAGRVHLALGILLFAAEAITILGTFELYISKMSVSAKEIVPMEIPKALYPQVDVLIATHNEPVDILYKTVNACTFMEYPDKDKVHIFICDDGNRPEVEQLAKSFGVGYIGCPNNQHAKSGNYNNALAKTKSPLIATFDADMIPQRQFLLMTVPYFFAQEWMEEGGKYRARTEEERGQLKKIGLVQTPQSFYNQDLFQFNLFMEHNIPNEQDYFSKEINVSRNATNSVAYTGSNTILLREAMEEIGGFPYHTITEDFETSIRMQKAGYITYAAGKVLAAGLSTTTVSSMMRQRIRWAQGVIQSIQNTNAIFTRKLSLAGRFVYLNSFLYWWSFLSRMIFILAPILFALFEVQLAECDFFQLLIFWLPAYLLYQAASRYASTNIRNLRWSQIIHTILGPYLIVPVLLESVGIHQRKFKVTNKKKESVNTTNFKFMIPHLSLVVLTILAILKFLYGKYGMALIVSSIIIFWLFYNLQALIFAVFFMMGRKSYRKFERIRADEKIRITVHGKSYEGRTLDVSEEGMAFCLEKSFYMPDNEAFEILVETPFYRARLSASLAYMREIDKGYCYGAMVKPESEKDLRQYLQIIHDRPHTHPKELDMWMTAYDDIIKNIYRRFKKTLIHKRKALRIPIQQEITFSEDVKGYVIDFNYHCLAVKNLQMGQWDGRSPLKWELEDCVLYLRKREQDQDKRQTVLLEIENLSKLTDQGICLTEIAGMIKKKGNR